MLVFNVAGCVRDNLVLCKVNKITWKVSVNSIPVDRDDLIIWRQSNFTKGDHAVIRLIMEIIPLESNRNNMWATYTEGTGAQ